MNEEKMTLEEAITVKNFISDFHKHIALYNTQIAFAHVLRFNRLFN